MAELELDRRTLLALGAASAIALPAAARAQQMQMRPNEDGPYDLVLIGGRVVDPETGLDAVRNVGIKGDRVAAISEAPLEGAEALDAAGMIVGPGFIDLHAHGQQLPAAWVQAFDGVTTALELESGLLPISRYYDLTAAEGRPINYGASVAWTYARIAEKEGIEPDGTLEWFQQAFSFSNWQNTLATPEELERILDRVEAGLRDGGIGIGVNAGYAPGYADITGTSFPQTSPRDGKLTASGRSSAPRPSKAEEDWSSTASAFQSRREPPRPQEICGRLEQKAINNEDPEATGS
jgi:N-acyl-D-glutamate deacylase